MENKLDLIRREILVRLAKAFFEKSLIKTIDRIPIEMRPRDSKELSRCCVYKDREMIRYRIIAAMGLGEEDETDELTPLFEFAQYALYEEKVSDKHLTILTDLCSACIKAHYRVTDVCRGCVARPCTLSCGRDAVEFINGRAHIKEELCVNCGKCMTVCPYQAIIRVPVPCEDACPTGAISKDENGKEEIDLNKCILCGKCLTACPFGAVAERSQIIHVLKALTGEKHTTALIAPSIAGQFAGTFEQLITALKKLGFDEVVEVAEGAVHTAVNETIEFKEKMEQNQPFMTTSCCPAYVMATEKLLPKLKPYVSHTPSPMIYSARIAKERYPETHTVFIGPCLAKRSEAFNSGIVDNTITFDELDALFGGRDIVVSDCTPAEWKSPAAKEGRMFAVTGGVANSVKHCAGGKITFNPLVINGFDRKSLKQLPSKLLNRNSCNFIEVMTCEGGCVAGPGGLAKVNIATQSVEKLAAVSASIKLEE